MLHGVSVGRAAPGFDRISRTPALSALSVLSAPVAGVARGGRDANGAACADVVSADAALGRNELRDAARSVIAVTSGHG